LTKAARLVPLKNGSAATRLTPENEKTCTGGDLAVALAKIEFAHEHAEIWRHEREASRKNLPAPGNKRA
jgi:hypothetical protein